MRVGLLRAVGSATAVYGLAVAARPGLLAGPSGLTVPGGGTPPGTAVALRPLAWRDATAGAAMAVAPEGPALRTATVLRIAADVGDAVLLGTALPGRGRRLAAAALSLGWGALSAAGLLSADRPGTAHQGARPRPGRSPGAAGRQRSGLV